MTDPKPAPVAARDRLTAWIGVAGSIVTVVLTIWNGYTKSQIDKREADLRALEVQLKERAAGVEESKERVDRYKWVLSLFQDVTGTDTRKRNFTIGLIQLALTKEEARDLFAGLNASEDSALQSIGRSGIAATQIAPIALLVSQMNAGTPDIRKAAVAQLLRDYRASPEAIGLTLQAYDASRITQLSESGVINGLYYLAGTDPNAWEAQHVALARNVPAAVGTRQHGPQTTAALDAFRATLAKVRTG